MMRNLTAGETALLGLVGEMPRYGYQIEALIEERGFREWTEIGFSSIYYLLGRLQEAGLISPTEEEGARPVRGKTRRTFEITDQGRRRLQETALRMISAPNRVHANVLIGMANWPALELEDGLVALEKRAAGLRAEIARLERSRAARQPLPSFVDVLFDHAVGQLASDLAWSERTRNTMEAEMGKVDFKKTMKELYQPSSREFELVDVPDMQFVKVDGDGDPNTSPAYRKAVAWLYAVSYAMKFAAQDAHGKDYVVPPLEGLWWAEDPSTFVTRKKDEWRWTMMIMVPAFVDNAIFHASVTKSAQKLGAPPSSLRLEPYAEGTSLQALHIGSYDDEGPVLARLYEDIMPAAGYTHNGPHHEIYLGDPRKTEPAKLKTVLRQPVRRTREQ